MTAFLVLLLAALSRLLPHALHGIGLNVTAVGGGLLYFGARRPRWQIPFAVAVMALTDVYLTTEVYQYPFHVSGYLMTWVWYGAVCLIGSRVLRPTSVLRVAAAVFASSTGFFLLSNLLVWMAGGLYSHSVTGLETCYIAALPFYGNDLVSTGLTSGVLFGLPVLAQHLVKAWQPSGEGLA